MMPSFNSCKPNFLRAGAADGSLLSAAPVLFRANGVDGNPISPLPGVTIKSFHRWFRLVTKWFCRQLGVLGELTANQSSRQ